MDTPHYLTMADVLIIHELMMRRFGRSPAPLRNEGLLESAIMRPRMAAYYDNADIIEQSALLAISISQAQAFMDGNKRTAFAACDVFLRLNGYAFAGDPIALAKQLEIVAERKNSLEEASAQFALWLRNVVCAKDDL